MNATPGDATEVNTNFNDLVTFLTDHVLHRDGSKALTAAWSAGGNRITNLAAPTSDNDAARKVYVDNAVAAVDLSGVLSLAGGTMEGPIDLDGNAITGAVDPTDPQDVATKAYADLMLPLTGGTMSGEIAMGTNKITGLAAPAAAGDAARKTDVDAVSTVANAALPRSGGTMTGALRGTNINIANDSTDPSVSTDRVVLANVSGGIIMGVRTSDNILYLRRNTVDGNVAQFYKNSTNVGSISVTGSATAFNTSSDRRLKTNIHPMAGALGRLLELRPVSHTWRAEPGGRFVDGLIADEVWRVVPNAVTGEPNDPDSYQQVDYSKLVPLLIGAVQELADEVEALRAGA